MALRFTSNAQEAAIFGIIIIEALSSLFDALPLLKFEKKAIVSASDSAEEVKETIVPQEILDEIPDAPTEEDASASPEETGGADNEE